MLLLSKGDVENRTAFKGKTVIEIISLSTIILLNPPSPPLPYHPGSWEQVAPLCRPPALSSQQIQGYISALQPIELDGLRVLEQ